MATSALSGPFSARCNLHLLCLHLKLVLRVTVTLCGIQHSETKPLLKKSSSIETTNDHLAAV